MVKLTRVGALIAAGEADPEGGAAELEKARTLILEALDRAGGDRATAAKELGVSVVAFRAWVNRLDLWERIDALCTAKNYHVQPGPKRGRKLSKITAKLS